MGDEGLGPGYHFGTERQRKASYLCALDNLGLLKESGSTISYDRYFDSSFFVFFKLSHEVNNYPR